ncbi:hypothetical protein [Dyella japonica]|uniref:Uncharacterized protein n=1 Tax=Dyella japonica TaxID=231455 RepID=A0ABV2JZR0_9GAMM
MIVKGSTDFTPGPWSWWTSNSVKRLTAERGRNGGVLSAIRCSDGMADIEVKPEDARLIAAAPDLLDALEVSLAFVAAWAGVYQHNHGLKDFHPKHAAAIEQIKAAISKAKGEKA